MSVPVGHRGDSPIRPGQNQRGKSRRIVRSIFLTLYWLGTVILFGGAFSENIFGYAPGRGPIIVGSILILVLVWIPLTAIGLIAWGIRNFEKDKPAAQTMSVVAIEERDQQPAKDERSAAKEGKGIVSIIVGVILLIVAGGALWVIFKIATLGSI